MRSRSTGTGRVTQASQKHNSISFLEVGRGHIQYLRKLEPSCWRQRLAGSTAKWRLRGRQVPNARCVVFSLQSAVTKSRAVGRASPSPLEALLADRFWPCCGTCGASIRGNRLPSPQLDRICRFQGVVACGLPAQSFYTPVVAGEQTASPQRRGFSAS